MLYRMANTTTNTGTRTGIFFTSQDKALIRKLKKALTTPLGAPNQTKIVREGLLALAKREGVA